MMEFKVPSDKLKQSLRLVTTFRDPNKNNYAYLCLILPKKVTQN